MKVGDRMWVRNDRVWVWMSHRRKHVEGIVVDLRRDVQDRLYLHVEIVGEYWSLWEPAKCVLTSEEHAAMLLAT